VFALGLIYVEYLTGTMPPFDPAFREPAVAVLNGAHLRLPPATAPQVVAELVEGMLLADPAARPTIEHVHATLMGWRSGAPTTAAPLRPPPPITGPPGAGSSLRGKGLRLAGTGHRAPSGDTTPVAPPAGAPGSPSLPVGDTATPIPAVPEAAATADAGRGFGKLVGKLLGKLETRRSR